MANQQKLGKTLEELQTLIARLKAGDLQLNELESLVLNALLDLIVLLPMQLELRAQLGRLAWPDQCRVRLAQSVIHALLLPLCLNYAVLDIILLEDPLLV